MTIDQNSTLFKAAKKVLHRWSTIPFRARDYSGDTVCLDLNTWREFNFGEMQELETAIYEIERIGDGDCF